MNDDYVLIKFKKFVEERVFHNIYEHTRFTFIVRPAGKLEVGNFPLMALDSLLPFKLLDCLPSWFFGSAVNVEVPQRCPQVLRTARSF
jgi:hypothetical protein